MQIGSLIHFTTIRQGGQHGKNVRRFTIYVPRELSSRLNAVRQEHYQDQSRQDMLRDLIARDLAESEKPSREQR